MSPGSSVLVEMRVGVQLECQVGSVYLNGHQPSISKVGVGLTQKENNRHAVAHPQNGSLLTVKTDRRVVVIRASVGIKGKMVD